MKESTKTFNDKMTTLEPINTNKYPEFYVELDFAKFEKRLMSERIRAGIARKKSTMESASLVKNSKV